MTGRAARGPRAPNPRTALPSVAIATDVPFAVRAHASAGRRAMALATRPTPGVYASDRSCLVRTATRGVTSILPPRWYRKIRSETWRTRDWVARAFVTASTCSSLAACRVRSTVVPAAATSTRSIPTTTAPAEVTAWARRDNRAGWGGARTRTVTV